jgi:hypothetical protein
VERDHAEEHRVPLDLDQAGPSHDVRNLVRRRIGPDALDEVAIGLGLADQATGQRNTVIEPSPGEAPDERSGPRDLEAGDPAARSHDPPHLTKATAVIGQVPHAERDGRGVHRPILEGQAHRIADYELELHAVRGPGASPGDHPL